MRRGFTITEAVLAAALLGGITVAIMQTFAVTQRHATSAEAQLNSALLAQMVMERVRANIAQNPRWLRDVCDGQGKFAFTGTVVDPASATNAAGLQLSPFFTNLFTRATGDLSAPENAVSIKAETAATPTGMKPEELKALIDSYRDHRVAVTMADDVDLSAAGGPATPFAQVVKRVTVTVSRNVVLANTGADPLAYTITTRVAVPSDSLSPQALELVARRFDGPDLPDQWLEFFYVASSNPWVSTRLSLQMRRVVADVFLVLAAANNEALLIDGTPLPDSVVTDGNATAKFINPWIAELTDPAVIGFSSSKVELARLRSSKAAVIFDAFKRLRLPGAHLCDEVLGPLADGRTPLARIAKDNLPILGANLARQATLHTQAVAAFDDLAAQNANVANLEAAGAFLALPGAKEVQSTSLGRANTAYITYRAFIRQQTAYFDSLGEVITVMAFLRQLLTDPKYKLVSTRPAGYADRFRGALDELSALLESHLDQVDGKTAYEHMAAAQLFVEDTMARQVERNADDGAARARLTALAAQVRPRMAQLASYLTGDTHDLAALKVRFGHFRTRCEELQALSPRYKKVIDECNHGGSIDRFLLDMGDLLEKLKIDIGDTLGKLNEEIEKGEKGGKGDDKGDKKD